MRLATLSTAALLLSLVTPKLASAASPEDTPAQVETEEAIGDFGKDPFEDVEFEATNFEDEVAVEEETLLQSIAYTHPATVHLPIAWVLLAFIFAVAHRFTGRKMLDSAAFLILALALLSFIPATITGLLRLETYPSDPEVFDAAVKHRNVMIAGIAATLGAFLLRYLPSRNAPQESGSWPYLVLLGIATLIVGYGGHLGGELVFGDLLPF